MAAAGLTLLLVLLGRQRLLAGEVTRVALTLLLSLLALLPLLFVGFSAVAYSFRGRTFETGVSLLLLLGMGLVAWGQRLSGQPARLLITAGVVIGTCATLTLLP
ncbi:hypothetical protein DKM44_12335 [Deinococcus irradiatisoli]|uniref:Uncharacterized protein n=1 Tax=Deinococcus irradiatisoli TaxID=2202254 RepID=A0A2Z3JK21_9DEIO|nr:hypothetical protein DKM44_12335 [Deinococcus irradiatisoli]